MKLHILHLIVLVGTIFRKEDLVFFTNSCHKLKERCNFDESPRSTQRLTSPFWLVLL